MAVYTVECAIDDWQEVSPRRKDPKLFKMFFNPDSMSFRQWLSHQLRLKSFAQRKKFINTLKNDKQWFYVHCSNHELTDDELKFLNFMYARICAKIDAKNKIRNQRRVDCCAVQTQNDVLAQLDEEAGRVVGDGVDREHLTVCYSEDFPVCCCWVFECDDSVEKPKKKKFDPMSAHDFNQLRNDDESPQDFVVRMRDLYLVSRLKLRISEFQMLRVKISCRNKIIYRIHKIMEDLLFQSQLEDCAEYEYDDDIVGQMSAVQEEDVQVEKKSNVILTNTTGMDIVKPVVSGKEFWASASTSDGFSAYTNLVDRWSLLKYGTWSKDDPEGKMLCTFVLPQDFLKDNYASPNAAPFCQYAYWQGDIAIRIHLNSTPFNVGCLIVSWYYAEGYDARTDLRNSKYSSVLLPHVIIDASKSNDVELVIPYRNYKPLMSMYSRENDDNFADLGQLRIQVLNPLLISAYDSQTTIDYSVYISFPNSRFSGLLPREDAKLPRDIQGQMFSVMTTKKVVNFASDALDAFIPDPNRDNPPIVSSPIAVYQQPGSSLAIGTDAPSYVETLRLCARGQTPHPGSVNVDEMSLNYLLSQEGLYQTIKWSTSNSQASVLSTLAASPLQSEYPEIPVVSDNIVRNCYVYTPVHIFSSLFQYWRGSLKFRIQVVHSQFQVGSLLIGYIPRRKFDLDKVDALSLLRHGYHAIIDLSTQSEYEFVVPYIADKPWWPFRERYDVNASKWSVDPPGNVYIVVLNALKTTRASCADECYINLFIRAGDDFEVSLPANPRLGLSLTTAANINVKGRAYVDPDYRKEFGIGTWRYLDAKRLILRYGSGSDHITQFQNLKNKTVYKISEYGNYPRADFSITVAYMDDNKVKQKTFTKVYSGTFQYLARVIVNGDKDTYQYATLFNTLEQAQRYVNDCPNGFADSSVDYMPCLLDKDYYTIVDDIGAAVWVEVVESKDAVIHQNADCIVLNPSQNILMSTDRGMITYGEQFVDVKTLCRRYQPYVSFEVIPQKIISSTSLQVDGYIAIQPQGFKPDTISLYGNLNREGVIGLVCSAFRFFRGGLRFKFVFNTPHRGTVYLQYIYDNSINAEGYVEAQKSLELTSHTIQPGYPVIVQNLNMNNVISVEVPFYLPTNYGLLQPYKTARKTESIVRNMGYFALKFVPDVSDITSSMKVDVFYSFADDMHLSTFIGCPPVFEVSTIEDQSKLLSDYDVVEPQMFKRSRDKIKDAGQLDMKYAEFLSKDDSRCENFANILNVETDYEELLKDESFTDSDREFIKALSSLKKKMAKSPDFISKEPTVKAYLDWKHKTLMEKLGCYLDNKLKSTTDQFSEKFSRDIFDNLNSSTNNIWDYISSLTSLIEADKRILIVQCFSQIAHVIANPSLKTFCIAIVATLASIGLIACSFLGKLIDVISNAYKRVYEYLTPNKLPGGPDETTLGPIRGQNVHDLSLNDDEKSSLLATLVGGITGAIATASNISCRNMPDFTKGLFTGIGNTARTTNQLTIFFKNNLVMVQKIVRWVIGRIMPTKIFQFNLEDEEDYINQWYEDVKVILNPANEEKVKSDPSYNLLVYKCAIIAEAYRLKYMRSDIKQAPILMATCLKVIALRDELVRNKLSPEVRFEPWVLCLGGESNVGKSHIIENLSHRLLNKIGWKGYSEIIFTRTPSNQYWNGVNSQPFVLYDDFLQVTSPEGEAQDIQELFCLKSKAVFNPPMAAIPDKHIRYNPLGVFLCMNREWKRPACVSDPQAYFRRRDCLVRVIKKDEYKHIHPRDLPEDIKQNYGHLTFSFYRSSTDEQAGFDRQHCSYEEFCTAIETKFEKFYKEELSQYMSRIEAKAKFYPNVDDSIEDTLNRYKSHLKMINKREKHDLKKDLDQILVETRDKLVGQDGVVKCYHVDFDAKYFEYTEDIVKTSRELGVVTIPTLSADSVPAFYSALDPTKWCSPTACTESSCVWHNVMVFDKAMKEWQDAHQPLFEKYLDPDVQDKSGILPLYFINNAKARDSNIVAKMNAHNQVMVQLKDSLDQIKKNHMEEMSTCKKIAYKVLKFIKRVLYLLLKVIGFSLFLVAVQGGASYLGNKLGVWPYSTLSKNQVTQPISTVKDLCSGGKDYVLDKLPIKKNVGAEMAYEVNVPSASQRPTLAKIVKPQLANDVFDSMVAKLRRNYFFLNIRYKDGRHRLMRCLGVCGRVAIILDHYHFHIKKSIDIDSIQFIDEHVTLFLNYNDCMFQILENSAIVFVRMPKNIPPFKDIRKLFITSTQTSMLNYECKVIEMNINDKLKYDVMCHNLEFKVLANIVVPGEGYPDAHVSNIYSYPLSRNGLCCAVVCTTNNVNNPIIGFHIAGRVHSNVGYAEAFVQDSFETVDFSDCFDKVLPHFNEKINPIVNLPANVRILGCVEKKFEFYQSPKSSQEHSMCYNQIFPSTYDFPLLSDKDPRIATSPFSPMQQGCFFHGQVTRPFENKFLRQAVDYYKTKILSKVKPARAQIGVLSVEEAIVGMDVEHYDALDFDTSEGYPYTSMRPSGAKGKRWLFDLEQTVSRYHVKQINQQLLDVMSLKQKQREQGIIPYTLFTDCLKDLKLPKEKCLQPGKTRIFSISPCDFTIQFRQYFMDFSVSYQNSRFDVDHAIGIDVNSLEWSELVYRLHNISDNILVADYSKFGPTLMSSCVLAAFEIIIEWYKFNGDDSSMHEQVRKVMAEETAFSYHLMYNLVYQVMCGSPSGHPLTTIINSIVNCLYILTVFLQTGMDVCTFENCVKLITYGDDLIMSVSDVIKDVFNIHYLMGTFLKYGIKLTDASKNELEDIPMRRILDPDVTFLKRRFVVHPWHHHVYLAQLDERAVKEVCNWVFKSNNKKLQSVVACQAMMENCIGHGPVVYSEYCMKVMKFWAYYKEHVVIPTWDAVSERCFGCVGTPHVEVYNTRLAKILAIKDSVR